MEREAVETGSSCGACKKTSSRRKENNMQKITPFLWFDDQAEEAARFYTSIFKNSKILNVSRYDDAGAAASGRPKGSAMTVEFELNGQQFTALNGGPTFKFTEAISFVVNCETQQEVDDYWEKLNEGGDKNAQQCGWLKDKYGLSWQIVPNVLAELVSDPDPEKAGRVMQAMLAMKKIDIKALRQAYEGNKRETVTRKLIATDYLTAKKMDKNEKGGQGVPGKESTYLIVKSSNASTIWILKLGKESTICHFPGLSGNEVTFCTRNAGNEETTFTL